MKKITIFSLFILLCALGFGARFDKISASEVSRVTTGNAVVYLTGGTQTEINAAITNVNAAGGGKVHLSPGTYTTTDTINGKDDVYLEGDGHTTIIDAGGWDTGSAIVFDTLHNCGVLNLTVDISGRTVDTSTPSGIRMDDCNDILIEGVYVHGYNDGTDAKASGDGIKIVGSENVLINRCHVDGCWHNIFAGYGSTDIRITNCKSGKAGAGGICLEWAVLKNGTGTHDRTDENLYAWNNRCNVSNCDLYKCSDYGIYLGDWDDVDISNVTVTDIVNGGNPYGIVLNGYSQRTNINNITMNTIGSTGITVSTNDAQNITICNIGIVSAVNGMAINGDYVSVANCSFDGITNNCFNLNGNEISIHNCIGDTTADGDTNPNDFAEITGGTNYIFTGCTIMNMDLIGWDLNAGTVINIIGNNILCNLETSAPIDAESGVTDLNFSYNLLQDPKTILLGSDKTIVMGNIWQSLAAGEAYAVDFEATAEDGICAYNFCDSTEYGTDFCDTTDATNITVADNLH